MVVHMVQALSWVHSKGYVHMDVNVSQGRASYWSFLPSLSTRLPVLRLFNSATSLLPCSFAAG